jgi:methyltransferase OMS1
MGKTQLPRAKAYQPAQQKPEAKAYQPPPPRPKAIKPNLRTTQGGPLAGRRFAYVLFLTSGTAFFFYAAYHATSVYVQLKRPPPTNDDGTTKSVDLKSVYNKTAREFDDTVDSTEYWCGIMKLRRRMIKQAQGHVLESAAGTGRNLEFFDRSRMKSLLMVDKSEGMLEICRAKWDSVRQGERWDGKVRFWVGDLEIKDVEHVVQPTVLGNKVDEGFDTIVQTMGLCSTDDPEGLLKNLGKLVKQDGRIMLLEHGKSHYDWLNRILDQTAPQHAAKHGCWWNRDIGAIAEKSGLQVMEIKRSQFGTTWWVELKRRKGDSSNKITAPPLLEKEPLTQQRIPPNPWWWFWK